MIWLWIDGFVSSCRLEEWDTKPSPESNPLLFSRKQLTSILSVNGAALSSICGPEMFIAAVSASCSTGRVNVVALAWSFFIGHLLSSRSARHLNLYSPTTQSVLLCYAGHALYRAACLSGCLRAGFWSSSWRQSCLSNCAYDRFQSLCLHFEIQSGDTSASSFRAATWKSYKFRWMWARFFDYIYIKAILNE